MHEQLTTYHIKYQVKVNNETLLTQLKSHLDKVKQYTDRVLQMVFQLINYKYFFVKDCINGRWKIYT